MENNYDSQNDSDSSSFLTKGIRRLDIITNRSSNSDQALPRIVIIGGGYGGSTYVLFFYDTILK